MGHCCSKKYKIVKVHELAFMNICTEGMSGNPDSLDKIFKEAEKVGATEEIFNAQDEEGDLPIHRASMNGNPECLKWIFDKWKQHGRPINVEELDGEQRTPLYLACYKGFIGQLGQFGHTPNTMQERLETVRILIQNGADVNFATKNLKMTPLHWAAHQGDAALVKLLLHHKAIQSETTLGSTPVDIAGFCGRKNVILEFAEHLAKKISLEQELLATQKAKGSQHNTDDIEAQQKKQKNSQILPTTQPSAQHLQLTADGKKTHIVCLKSHKSEMSLQDNIDLRTFYWCANQGWESYLRLMIQYRRWSPFIKSFRSRSVISGAIWGSQTEVVRYLLGEYQYDIISNDQAVEFAQTVFNKDSSDNNCLHYSYMIDLPEVRQILRQNGLYNERAQKLNLRGQLPPQLRHAIKADDSNEITDDEHCYQLQKNELDKVYFSTDRKQEAEIDAIKEDQKRLNAIRKEFDINDKKDPYRLCYNTQLTRKQKLAHYKTPNYCLVTRVDTLKLLRIELDSLVVRGGVYYSIFRKVNDVADFDKPIGEHDTMMVVLYYDDAVIDLMGEIMQLECRVSKADCQLPFQCFAADKFDQFNSRQIQAIVQKTLHEELDLDYLHKAGAVSDHFNVHTAERDRIAISWKEHRFKLMWGMLTGNYMNEMQPINFIKEYYGEKFGFYFAWLTHYTAWLIPLGLTGLAFGIAIIITQYEEFGAETKHIMASPLVVLYGIIVMLWITLMHESWKRKENSIANAWLVRNFEDATTEMPEYKCEISIDPDTQHIWKVSLKDAYMRQMLIGVPVSLAFIIVIFLSQCLLQYVNIFAGVDKQIPGQKPHPAAVYLPGVANTVLIIVFSAIYMWLAQILVKNENHRYTSDYENSLINKVYMVTFINTYIGNFIQILWYQDFNRLVMNMVIQMIVKQLVLNLLEWLMDMSRVGWKLRKVRKIFEQPLAKAAQKGDIIAEAELKMHYEIEKQIQMTPQAETLVFNYNEASIQLGFIACFAVSFPFAPLFSFITNLLEVKIKLNQLGSYGRRNEAQCTSGIGNWMQIMGFISNFAIPMNIVILLVCGFPKDNGVGALDERLDEMSLEYYDQAAPLAKYLMRRDRVYWNRANIICWFVVLEHVIIGLKAFIALVIPDVPREVKEAEIRREHVKASIEKELYEEKFKGNHQTVNDLMDQMTKQALEAKSDDEGDDGTEVDPDLLLQKKKKAALREEQLAQQMNDLRKKAMIQIRQKNQLLALEKKRRHKEEKKRIRDLTSAQIRRDREAAEDRKRAEKLQQKRLKENKGEASFSRVDDSAGYLAKKSGDIQSNIMI